MVFFIKRNGVKLEKKQEITFTSVVKTDKN